MNHLDLFSGIGGFPLAAGWAWKDDYNLVALCENDDFCTRVLNKNFPNVPVISDIREVSNGSRRRIRTYADDEGQPQQEGGQPDLWGWAGDVGEEANVADTEELGRGDGHTTNKRKTYRKINPLADQGEGARIDLITGGFPCQPFSVAGRQGGTQDDRYLWPEMARVIKEFKPTWVVAENVPGILSMAHIFEQVCLDMESEGYEVWPVLIPACGVGALHPRNRVWFIAYNAESDRRRRDVENAVSVGHRGRCDGDETRDDGQVQAQRPRKRKEQVVLADSSGGGLEGSDTERRVSLDARGSGSTASPVANPDSDGEGERHDGDPVSRNVGEIQEGRDSKGTQDAGTDAVNSGEDVADSDPDRKTEHGRGGADRDEERHGEAEEPRWEYEQPGIDSDGTSSTVADPEGEGRTRGASGEQEPQTPLRTLLSRRYGSPERIPRWAGGRWAQPHPVSEWFVADTSGIRSGDDGQDEGAEGADTGGMRKSEGGSPRPNTEYEQTGTPFGDFRMLADGIPGGVDGFRYYSRTTDRSDRIKALGNAIVPDVAYELFVLMRDVDDMNGGKPIGDDI